MRPHRPNLACPLALAAAFVLAAPTAAPAATVSGKVKRASGYTIVAVARDGKVQSRRLSRSGAFKFKLRGRAARGATLALVAPDGTYAGPVVLRRERSRAFLGLSGRGNPRLGAIVRKSGFAIVRRSLPRRAVDARRPSRAARGGRPTGAGRLGLVAKRRRTARAAQAADAGRAGEDADRDGVIGAVDVDDDGDRVLDVSDASGTASGGVSGELVSSLPVDLEQSLNANAAGVTPAQIDALLRDRLNLLVNFSVDEFSGVPGPVSAVGVDCLGVGWCQTAEVANSQTNRSEGLWRDRDQNGDGLLDVPRAPDAPVFQILIWPRATTSQIAPGDTLQLVASTGAGRVRALGTLDSYFTTVPAIKAWDDGTGPKEFTYPVPPGTAGTKDRALELASEKLRLTFWRPQRAAIPGAESSAFTDMGRLYYGVDLGIDGVHYCTAADYSNLSPTLSPAPPSFARDENLVLRDSAPDAAPNTANTLSFTVDLGACLRRAGVNPSGRFAVLTLRGGGESRDAAGQHLNIRFP